MPEKQGGGAEVQGGCGCWKQREEAEGDAGQTPPETGACWKGETMPSWL